MKFCIGDGVRPEYLEYFAEASVLKDTNPVVDRLFVQDFPAFSSTKEDTKNIALEKAYFRFLTNFPSFPDVSECSKCMICISLSELPSAVILDPRYVNSSTSSMFSPCSFIGSFVLLFILMCLVFAMLALSPIFCAVVESASVFYCMSER